MAGKKEGQTPAVAEKCGRPRRFAIAGESTKWYWADAQIDGENVVFSIANVAKPLAARYAYQMNPRQRTSTTKNACLAVPNQHMLEAACNQ